MDSSSIPINLISVNDDDEITSNNLSPNTSISLPTPSTLSESSLESLTLELNQTTLDFKSFSTATLPTLSKLPSSSTSTSSSSTVIPPISPLSSTFPSTSPPPLFPRVTSPTLPSSTVIPNNDNKPSQASIGPGGSGSIPSSSSSSTTATGKRPGPGVGGVIGGGNLRSGVRGSANSMQSGGMKIPPSLQAKMAAMASRSSSSSSSSSLNNPITSPPLLSSRSNPPVAGSSSSTSSSVRGSASGLGGIGSLGGLSSRVVGPGLPKRNRPGLTLSAMQSSSAFSTSTTSSSTTSGSAAGGSSYGSVGVGTTEEKGSASQGGYNYAARGEGSEGTGTPFSNFRKIVDPSGRLNFASKAVVHADGVDFSSGASFKIKMDDFELYEELGKGNYGTVQKVWHKPTKVTMALKEIRLELDDSKLKTIITELDILHRATSPYIIDFYGAFFIESCVYYCMEYMDAGSLEKVAGCDVPEDVLSRVTRSMVEGLKFLKDELKIMHRDVKPTNVLINRNGFVKLCDFGVSGQLDRSLAKTNIGCQSYMAPERIKGESQGAPSSYTASSDVWSLGLSIIEFAIGHYPYPPETYSNVFAQLTAIVHGEPPVLPERYSEVARGFVGGCLEKVAHKRPSYAALMEHPFLKNDIGREVDMVGWINGALAYREKNPKIIVPALA